MNQEQALFKLDSLFHEDFKKLCQTYLSIDEEILGVSYCCASYSVGYLAITTLRAILVQYEDPPPPLLGRRPYYATKEMELEGRKVHFQWRPPPAVLPKKADIERRIIKDSLHSELKRVENKNYVLQYDRQSVHLTSLICYGRSSPLFFPLTFRAEAGQEIYNVLLKCLRGDIGPRNSTPNYQLIAELERLAALYKAGLLSSEQFEAAKNKLL